MHWHIIKIRQTKNITKIYYTQQYYRSDDFNQFTVKGFFFILKQSKTRRGYWNYSMPLFGNNIVLHRSNKIEL